MLQYRDEMAAQQDAAQRDKFRGGAGATTLPCPQAQMRKVFADLEALLRDCRKASPASGSPGRQGHAAGEDRSRGHGARKQLRRLGDCIRVLSFVKVSGTAGIHLQVASHLLSAVFHEWTRTTSDAEGSRSPGLADALEARDKLKLACEAVAMADLETAAH